MKIQYKDFFPKVKSEGLLANEYETLQETLIQANNWLAKETINLVNIETVLLPRVRTEEEASTNDLFTGNYTTHWSQVIRIWYIIP